MMIKRCVFLAKGQTWSTDALVAVVIFMVVVVSFFYITGRSVDNKKLDDYADDAGRIPELFAGSSNSSLVFIQGNKVDVEKLENLTVLDYEQMKQQLGISSDFCIHFEDEKGNVIFINSTNNITGIGSPKAVIGNYTCFSRR